MTGLALDVANSGGETLGRAQFEQDNQKILGLQNVVAIGQGQSGRAQAGLSGLAQESASDAISEAVQQFNRRSANLQLVGSIAGAGARYGQENNWGLGLPEPKPDVYSMDTSFNTDPNYFTVSKASGGLYGLGG